MTARDAIANAIDHPEFDHRHPIQAAVRILSALQSASEADRQELASLILPWRPTKIRDGREAYILATEVPLIAGRSIVAMYRVNETEWALNSWFADGRFYSDNRTDQIDLMLPLPAPPKEDKAT